MAYNITIAGLDRTADVISQSIVVEDVINDKANTCSFKVVDLSGQGVPATDDEVIITLADDTILFGGLITGVSLNKLKQGVIEASVSCTDYTYILDRYLAHVTYANQTDAAIITNLIQIYCLGLGITTTNVFEGVTINSIKFNYQQLSQALRKIAELTGRSWYIDYEKDIHYFPLTTNIAPFSISDAGTTAPETFIDEDMSGAPSGTLGDDAAFVTDHVRLTQAANNQFGTLYYSNALASTFTAEFTFWSGGGGGADAVYFGWGCSYLPGQEDAPAGYGGYVVAYDEYTDEIQLWFNGTLLTSVAQSGMDNSAQRAAKIVVDGTSIKIYLDGVLKIDFTDSSRTLGGSVVGLAARTGGVNNEHRIYAFNVYTEAGIVALDYTNLQISKNTSQLKNRVYVRGGTKLSDPTTYSVKGDGAARQFPLPDKPHDVTVTVNGAAKTLGVKNIDTTGYDWYLNFQEKYIEQDAGGAVLATTDTLAVTYTYDIPILVAVEDTPSIIANGVKEYAIFDKTIDTTQAARDRASAELTDYANDLIEGSFITHTPGFRSGQYININLTEFGINDDYLVQKVVARSIGAGNYYYQVSIASAKTIGIIKFLIRMLENDKNMIELDDDEVVDELVSLADNLISDSLTDALTIDSAGPYATWCTDSLDSTPTTRARWNLFQWG